MADFMAVAGDVLVHLQQVGERAAPLCARLEEAARHVQSQVDELAGRRHQHGATADALATRLRARTQRLRTAREEMESEAAAWEEAMQALEQRLVAQSDAVSVLVRAREGVLRSLQVAAVPPVDVTLAPLVSLLTAATPRFTEGQVALEETSASARIAIDHVEALLTPAGGVARAALQRLPPRMADAAAAAVAESRRRMEAQAQALTQSAVALAEACTAGTGKVDQHAAAAIDALAATQRALQARAEEVSAQGQAAGAAVDEVIEVHRHLAGALQAVEHNARGRG